MSAPQPPGRAPMSRGRTVVVVLVSVVGGLALVFGVLVAIVSLVGPDEPPTAVSPAVDVGTMCSALTTYPDKTYTIATSAIPPPAGSGRAGTAASYRQAADLVDQHCPSNDRQASLLRGMARIYDPAGG